MAYKTNVIKTVEGTAFTIPDNDQEKAILELKGNTSQTGTPSPSAPVSVNVVTGRQTIEFANKNQFSSEMELGTLSGTGVPSANNDAIRTKNFISVKPNTEYTISNDKDYYIYTYEYDKNGAFISGGGQQTDAYKGKRTLTTSATTRYIKVRTVAGLVQNDLTSKWQLEFGGSKTSYEPYIGKTFEINFGKNLFNKDDENNLLENKFINGSTSTVNASNGTASICMPCQPNTTYTLSKIKSSRFVLACTSEYPANSTPVSNMIRNDGATELTITTTSDAKYLVAFVYHSTYDTTITFEDICNSIQIETGGIKTQYSAYKTPIELCEIDTYQDSIKYANYKNICPFDISNAWESGHYGTSGSKQDSPQRIRLKYLMKVKPSTAYYFNTFNADYRFIVRTYNSAGEFIRSLGGVTNGNTVTTSATEEYFGISMYNATSSSGVTYSTYVTLFGNSSIKPFICLNSETNKTYEPYGKGWYIEKQIGKIILTGGESESWSYNSDNAVFSLADAVNYLTTGFVPYCDYYNGENISGYTQLSNNSISFLRSSTNNRIVIKNTSITQSSSGIKTWLQSNNTTAYYVKAISECAFITDTEISNTLNNIKLLHGLNNITVTSGDLEGTLKLTYSSTDNDYEDTVYSEDDRNRARIWFNDVELQDVGRLCEKITKKSRVLEENGKKIFALDGFVSTEVEVILHNVNVEDIQDQVKISIGTLIDADNNTWEDIPLGVFNIQDTPVVNDNKITLKLRDNRVKFDFNYNAKPLIDANGGSATKRQILEDICTQAGVENDIPYFEFENDEIGVYDSEITATNYVKYLAEQCGCIATIDRNGKLIFIDLNNLYVWRIPRRILPKPYTLETPYTIQRIVYESGITKYETSQNEDLDTLYLNGANVYINRQEQIDYIYNLLNGFTLDSVVTQKLLGNPEIDAYDIIEVYDDRDVSEPTIFRTLANNVYYFTGKHSQSFSTQIGKEQRKENVKKTVSEGQFRLWATTEINNLNGTVEIQTGRLTSAEEEISQIQNNFDNYATIEAIDNVQTQVNTLQTDTYSKTEVQQIANGTGVDGVKVTAVISTEATFDKDGMHYSKTDAPTSSTINYKGLEVDDNRGNEILYAGYDDDTTSVTYGNSIVRTDNLTVDTYLQCADGKGRIEKYTDENNNVGVGFFLT